MVDEAQVCVRRYVPQRLDERSIACLALAPASPPLIALSAAGVKFNGYSIRKHAILDSAPGQYLITLYVSAAGHFSVRLFVLFQLGIPQIGCSSRHGNLPTWIK